MAGQFEIEDDSGAKRIGITEFVTDSQGEWVDPCFLLIGIGPAYEHKFKREALLKWKNVVLDRIDTWNRDLAVFKTRKSIYELVGRDPEYQPEEEEEKLDQVSSEKNIPPPARPPPPLPRSPIGLAHNIMRRKEKSLTFFASERCICRWVEELVKEHERGFQHAIHDMQGRFQ
ncbi:hypothetical protein QBC37DRAFT_395533 [Rhypophila decipiens]|uniref:Uncharacterized protein n=1 Tax=Rhypophila decipiens TaxID=261697 RepID=A0AAN7BCB1_9PEZI|nr:hypothetical protein QBC37DRAFT_395533 [Rhypophila decipiens]